jgi:insulysin
MSSSTLASRKLSLKMGTQLLCFKYFCLLLSLVATGAHGVEIDKGSIDKRSYHYQRLDNQLQVLLISDPQADKAAAALDISVGSSADPLDRPGLAHFLEHMLFLGTEKYPQASEYQDFISAHGGSHNAYTSDTHTNYFFDVSADNLAPALDRFAQFFIAPLFDAAYVERERYAVHSEFQAKYKDDYRRAYDVYRQIVNPKHPDAKFNVGSLTTLADRPQDAVRGDLLDFYRRYYSADRMALIVLGRESIAELQQLVYPLFNQISEGNKQPDDIVEPLFLENTLPLEAIIKPESTVRSMTLLFPLPAVNHYYRQKPLHYIANIIGHEGEGSLLSLLKKQGWAEGLSTGIHSNNDDHAIFQITVQLSEAGINYRPQIRQLVFYALKILREHGIEAWRYGESQQLANIAFQYRETGKSIDTVSALANNLHDYGAADVIRGDYAYDDYDAALIKSYLAAMTPENLLVLSVFPEAKTDRISTYYQTPYALHRLSTKIVTPPGNIIGDYVLPTKNIFIPQSTDLLKDSQKIAESIPILLKDDNRQTTWFKQDISFGVPKANLLVRVKSPLVSRSLAAAAKMHLYAALVRDQLTERSYPANLGGLDFSLSANSRGIELGLEGYNDRMELLLDLILQTMAKPMFDDKRFVNVKQELIKDWNNSQKQTPYRRLFDKLPAVLFEPYWDPLEMAKAIDKVTVADISHFSNQWRQGAELQALLYGNIIQSAASSWSNRLNILVQPGDDTVEPARVLQLNNNKTIPEQPVTVDHSDKAVMLYVQGKTDTLHDSAKMLLLRQVLQSNFYNELRTEQQLGYIVFVTDMSLKEVPGSAFVVQSPQASVPHIQQSIQNFLATYIEQLPADLSTHKQAVLTRLLEQSQTLSEMAERYWTDIIKNDRTFSYRQRLADSVSQIETPELRQYYQNILLEPTRSYWLYATDKNPQKVPQISKLQQKGYYQYP